MQPFSDLRNPQNNLKILDYTVAVLTGKVRIKKAGKLRIRGKYIDLLVHKLYHPVVLLVVTDF